MTARHTHIDVQLSEDLRRAVLKELERRGLDEPEALAAALDLVPSSTSTLLQRETWSLRAAMSIVDKLSLPIRITVTSDEVASAAS